jgi:phosphoglycolate phosphatase
MRFRAVLFDLDGTLLDTVDDLADSANAIFERAGFPQHPVSAYKIFVGEGLRRFIERALPPDALDEETILRMMDEMREEYGRRFADKTRPYDGVGDMLDRLAELGVRASVYSNKPEVYTKKLVEKLLPRRDFEIVMGARDGMPRKPDPAGAVEIASRMGLGPSEFLYLGDTSIDMHTALAAGMFAVGALWGFRDEAELREAGAQEIVKTPLDVIPLLE